MEWLDRSAAQALIATLLVMIASVASATPAPAPAEAFGTLPAESDVVLSPDGHWLAWLDHSDVKPRVVMFDLVGRKPQRYLAVPERTKLRSLIWADSETLLITASETYEGASPGDRPTEFFRTIAHDATGGVGRMLLMDDALRLHFNGATLVAPHTSKPKTAVMFTADYSLVSKREEIGTRLSGHRKDSPWVMALFEVDTRTGKGTMIERGTQFTSNWVVDRDARIIAREEWDGAQRHYRVVAKSGLGFKEIYQRDDGSRLWVQGLSADGSAVIALGANGRALRALWALPLDGSKESVAAEDPLNDLGGVIHDPHTGAIIGAWVIGTEVDIRWFDPGAKQRSEALSRAFAGRRIHINGWSADGQKVLARVDSGSVAPVYYVVDFATHRAEIAAEEYPALANQPLGEVREITYPARDGVAIPAYLTLPADKSIGAAPLVVLPHGGPEARDYPGFDWLTQFFSSRGYAVLQPQFRGSSGFGEAHRAAGYRQWGGLMQDDVTDGVRAMISQGVADPHRVCIVGGSYGGYVALAGVAFTPELYRCAVSIGGVSDLPALLGTLQSNPLSKEYDLVAYWRKDIGVPSDPKLFERSPIHAVAAIHAPILLIHGTDDSVVPISQSEQMAQALKGAGKPVRLVKLDGEDHWLSHTATRIRVLKEIEGFLRENL